MTIADNLAWRTSTRSSNGEKCVEVAPTADGVAIRHSKRPTAGTITFPATAWDTFVREASSGLSSDNGVAIVTTIGTDTLVKSLHTALELRFDEAEWTAFVAGARAGEFNFASQRCLNK
ncbi:protein of unknown function [Saccharopolyspora antimicrobica]|uniref:Uncharacterized protein DUF397 n=1 Tax=Saccharopolyspora antimicrobica TaxID=455193 RepID=A0A1I5GZ22_9PSEU|nr:DUF397 domain-containing protein [Saccharopolyspora antimicrobica]RKT89280.1 uncharacterized protein DUF397 [Saccharopolyspora antimicrobica]SFO41203.1 protein of unknown function [Saccharopolyspora antimicrobica]